MNSKEEKNIFKEISNNNEIAFEKLFHAYYGHLCLFASRIIKNNDSAEEIVQDFFVILWEKRNQLSIETSVKSYLFTSVKNLCLNFIQHRKIIHSHEKSVLFNTKNKQADEDYFTEIYLAEKIEESIQSLPEKRRIIFKMSREDGLKYREIAKKLNISIKTVEAQMGLAIKSLRNKLKNYNKFF